MGGWPGRGPFRGVYGLPSAREDRRKGTFMRAFTVPPSGFAVHTYTVLDNA